MDTTVVIGTTPGGRQVHMAWRHSKAVLCDLSAAGPVLADVLAELSGEGEADTMAVLNEETVAVSRLCKHCFTIRFRTRLSAMRRTAGLRTDH